MWRAQQLRQGRRRARAARGGGEAGAEGSGRVVSEGASLPYRGRHKVVCVVYCNGCFLGCAMPCHCVFLLDGLAPCSPPYDLMERPYILYKMLSAASARRILILLALQTPKSREELRSTPKFQSSTRDFNGSIN